MSARALINVPAKAKRGDVIEIKTLISHIMETGFRHGTNGQMIPRDIITSFSCKYNSEEIFATTFYPAESYHRRYYELNPEQGYCRVVIAPKVAKFREKYLSMLRR